MKAQTDISDDSQVQILTSQALNAARNGTFDKAETLITEAHNKALQTGDNAIIAEVQMYAGDIYNAQNKKEQALSFYYRALKQAATTENPDTILTQNAHYKAGLIYFEYEAYRKALDNFSKLKTKDYNTLKYIGLAYEYSNDTDSAELSYNTMYKLAQAGENKTQTLESLDKLVNINKKQKDFESALEYNYLLYDIFLLDKNAQSTALIMNNIGYLNIHLKKYRAAFDAFSEAEKNYNIAKPDSRTMQTLYTNLGICSNNIGEREKSINYLLKALDIATKNKDQASIARTNNIIALTYFQNKDLYNAAEFSLEAVDAAERAGDNDLKKDVYLTYSSILQSLEDYQKALDYFKKHLLIRDSLIVEQRLREDKTGKRIQDLERAEKELRLKLADEEVQNAMLNQMRLEAEKKEQDMQLYRKEQELKNAEHERMLQQLAYEKQKRQAELREQQIKALEQEKAISDLELKRRQAEEEQRKKEIALLQSEGEKKQLELDKQKQAERTFQYIIALGTFIFLLILWFLIISRKKNRNLKLQRNQITQKNEELNQQNEEIITQKENLERANHHITLINQEMTDSIRYAKRIQTAVLPHPEVLGAGISDFFIFFKPKDIVSGDFYWSKQHGNKTIIAAADCTGHGVPGAFMSMLGISFLNEITNKQSENQTAADILNELRNKVKESLGQTGKKQEQKDGMDISLVILDSDVNEAQFAGANNSMLLVRNKELNQIKADRMPIGIHHKEEPFKNNQFEIKKNDVLYLYSDGFQDQFGGPSGRKYMTQNFRDLLFRMSHQPLATQAEYLEQTFTEWTSVRNKVGNSYMQMDDILVIGIKI